MQNSPTIKRSLKQFQITTDMYAMYLIQILAYPPSPDTQSDEYEQKRYELGIALYAGYVRYRGAKDKKWASEQQPIWVEPLLYDPKLTDNILRRVQKRFRERSLAGRIAIGYVNQYYQGDEYELPNGMKKFSLNSLCKLVANDPTGKKVSNIKTRIWKPSIPVIHIAAAMQTVWGDYAKVDTSQPTHIFDLMIRPDILTEIALKSRECAYALIHGQAGIKSQMLINLQDPPWVKKVVSK